MTIYRALSNLSGVCKRGELTKLAHLPPEQVQKLERVGAVAPISSPPLAELPDWSIRAGKLAKVGVVDIEQLLEADIEVVMKALRVKAETASQYQQDAKEFLIIREPSEQEE